MLVGAIHQILVKVEYAGILKDDVGIEPATGDGRAATRDGNVVDADRLIP